MKNTLLPLLIILSACSPKTETSQFEKAPVARSKPIAAQVTNLPPVDADQNRFEVTSPDQRLNVVLSDDNGVLHYWASYDGKSVIGSSKLGLRFADQHAFEEGLTIIGAEASTSDTNWQQPWGEARVIRDNHHELSVAARNETTGVEMVIRFRVFDDGFGFRYEMPKQDNYDALTIVNELTEFSIPQDATGWWIPARKWNRYEYIYTQSPIAEMPMVHTPVTFKLADGTHLSIHEAALVDYSGMALEHLRDGIFKADLAPSSQGGLAHVATPFVTPWRTVQVADTAPGLINSSLILNLNEPNKLGDVSWVGPGKYIGMWWGMHMRDDTWGSGKYHGATTEKIIPLMDFAAKYGFKGVLVEGWNIGWDGDWFTNGDLFSFTQSYPDFDMEKITQHGLAENVRLVGHHETSGSLSNYENQMEEGFALYEKNGVRLVKTGYVADAGGLKWVDEKGIAHFEFHDGQYSVAHHLRVLKAAAKHKISINSHEPVKDTGLRRTYPNWISREGARGSEYDAWGIPPNPPSHTAIIPFTRMLSGPMDYTPGIFNLRPNELPPVGDDFLRNDPRSRIETTLTKQLALYVVLYSPIQMAADLPKHYEQRPDAFQFILDVPVDWEQSRALAGEIGDYVVVARQERGGQDWFVGALTNEEARDVSFVLDFLADDTEYEAQIYRDGPAADYVANPYDYVIEKRIVGNADRLDLHLATSGGAAIRFKRL